MVLHPLQGTLCYSVAQNRHNSTCQLANPLSPWDEIWTFPRAFIAMTTTAGGLCNLLSKSQPRETLVSRVWLSDFFGLLSCDSFGKFESRIDEERSDVAMPRRSSPQNHNSRGCSSPRGSLSSSRRFLSRCELLDSDAVARFHYFQRFAPFY